MKINNAIKVMAVAVLASAHATSAGTQEICRGVAIPSGFIAVNYKSDFVHCPNPPGFNTVYTVVVIESYYDKSVGAAMTVCRGQSVPDGWVYVGDSNAGACPREPGDSTVGSSCGTIKRLR